MHGLRISNLEFQERRENLDASSRVLLELAAREQALDAKIEAARTAAVGRVQAAEAQAAQILKDAEGRMQVMTTEHEQALEAEVQGIRNHAQTQAGTLAQATRDRAEGKLQQAIETIMRAVLP
jgi:F-type H+-transporting ATPase subunit b